jgi:hypothetical protein
MNGKSNSQGAAPELADKSQRDSGWDTKKLSFFDLVEGRRPA